MTNGGEISLPDTPQTAEPAIVLPDLSLEDMRAELARLRPIAEMVADVGSLAMHVAVENNKLQDENEKLKDEIEKRKAVEKFLIDFGNKDPKTGLANEVAFDEELESRISAGNPLAVGKVDLTNFKAVNDRYGEDTGDEILKGVSDVIVASMLMDKTRKGLDFVARLHGDTYAFILDLEPREDGTATPEEIVENVKARILQGVNSYSELSALDQWGFTASIGIAIHTPGEDTALTLKRAEDLMKEHKAQQHTEVGAYRPSSTS